MKKVKRYEDGGDVSLEQKYPEAKITRVPPNEAPERPKNLETPRGAIPQDAMAEYEKKAEKFEKPKAKGAGRGAGGASGDYMALDKMLKARKMFYKSGGSVSSASKRADGCAVKGKTKGRMI